MVLARKTLSALALAVLISTAATSPANPEKKDDSTELAGLNWSFYNIAALSTAALVVSAGFAALVSLFLPVFAFKLCYLLGGCREALDVYVDQLVANELPHKRSQRSLDHLEPILVTLADAYQKYADEGTAPAVINAFRLVFLLIHVVSQLAHLLRTILNLFSTWYY